MNEYKITLGLEVHAELKTKSKMFCGCLNAPELGEEPNAHTCPVCMGHPGTLPVINFDAVKKVLLVGTAVGADLADFTEWDRKNYFYPDIPKGYQMSQYKYPLVSGGSLNGVRLTRIHLEEDTARSSHGSARTNADGTQTVADNNTSLVDFNRAGVPLMELVTEPVMHSAEEATHFAKELQLLLQYLDVSGANMEKGQMRVEVNISVARNVPEMLTSAETRGLDTDLTQNGTEEDFLYKELTYKIRGILFDVRKKLGLGHKEQVYHNALEIEFKNADIQFESKKNIPILYEGKHVGVYQPDFIIDDRILIELKALPEIGRPQIEQVWSYLKGCEYKLALLVNFGSKDLEIKRIIYDSARESSSAVSASSLRPSATSTLGTKVEVKNINSFRAVGRTIEFEYKRQTELLEKGEKVVQETRGWDENKQQTVSQRLKESAHDYRYFPDPDLPKFLLSEIPEFGKETLQKSLPELPWEKRARYKKDFGIKDEDIEVYVVDRVIGKFFEEVAIKLPHPDTVKLSSNYITSDLVGLSKSVGTEFSLGKIAVDTFAKLMTMVVDGNLSSRGAKDILRVMFEVGGDPEVIAEEKGLKQKNDPEELKNILETIVKNNPNIVEEYKSGKESVLQFLVGQGMKETKGSANPEMLKKIILELLK